MINPRRVGALAGAVGAGALASQDADASGFTALPKMGAFLGSQRARELAAKMLSEGVDPTEVYRQTGWDLDAVGPRFTSTKATLAGLNKQLQHPDDRAAALLSRNAIVRPFDMFEGAKIDRGFFESGRQLSDYELSILAADRGRPGARNYPGVEEMENVFNTPALFELYPDMRKANIANASFPGAVLYPNRNPRDMLVGIGESHPKLMPEGETDRVRSYLSHEVGTHAPSFLDGRADGIAQLGEGTGHQTQNASAYLTRPGEVAARSAQDILRSPALLDTGPSAAFDRNARYASRGIHHPPPIDPKVNAKITRGPKQGALFGAGAGGASLLLGALGSEDAEAGNPRPWPRATPENYAHKQALSRASEASLARGPSPEEQRASLPGAPRNPPNKQAGIYGKYGPDVQRFNPALAQNVVNAGYEGLMQRGIPGAIAGFGGGVSDGMEYLIEAITSGGNPNFYGPGVETSIPYGTEEVAQMMGINLQDAYTMGGAIVGGTLSPMPGPKGAKALDKLADKGRGILNQFETTGTRRILNKTRDKGGYSVSPKTGDVPTEGLMMGRYANDDPRNLVADKLTGALVEQHAGRNAGAFNRGDNYFGTWRDPEGGKTYLDVSKRFEPDQIRQATKFGEKTGQKAGFNVGTESSFPVNSWKGFIEGDEFARRSDEMAQVGRGYLAEHPAKEWWDIHDSAFERVYGRENLPQAAGFTAATAPNAQPRENLQTMSEYMRRRMAGENILQPDWRVPAGTMSRNEGKKIGMEQGRRRNLLKANEGALTEMRGPKVREEALALMGDPNAAVLDRHQIRLSEDPATGVFASGREGTIDDKGYMQLKGALEKRAALQGRNVRDYSADVWTGIRETIKTKSDLFGQPFKGSAIRGDSKSYADQFDDLIGDKAKFLGITKEEMERKLKAGDANLMSMLLATPLGAAIYAEFQRKPALADDSTS